MRGSRPARRAATDGGIAGAVRAVLRGGRGRRRQPAQAIANLEVESLRHIKPTFHGDTLYGETEVLDKTPSRSKDDRGVVYVETRGYNQDGTVVCVFRRKVMVPTRAYGDARGGEQPGRPTPQEIG